MPLSRRDFLQTGAFAGGALALAGCDGVYRQAAQQLGQTIPRSVTPPSGVGLDPFHHLLSRAGFGPWPGDVERARSMGAEAWIDEQLAPESIDDRACDLRANRFETVFCPGGEAYEYRRPVVHEELARFTLLRALYSRRQLHEVMVEFWSDHFNMDIGKAECAWLKSSHDREVLRAHALGRFRDLVRGTALSPAMLVYLDGRANKRARNEDRPNENFARELLELHTLGVHGGYTQRDVMEAARALTGWTVRKGWRKGSVEFRAADHDDGPKEVLGVTIPAGHGERDLDLLLDIVLRHPSTSRHLAVKLCRRFVSEQPPESLVERVAEAYRSTNGEIRPMVRAILTSEEFRRSAALKVKRPFRYVVSALRSLGADTFAHRPLLEYLSRMGQPLFSYPTPDGYPDENAPWLGAFFWRWNFAVALVTNRIGKTSVDLRALNDAIAPPGAAAHSARWLRHLLGRDGTPAEQAAIDRFLGGSGGTPAQRQAEAVGLILASPGFQWF
ncbi:MAG: DUF1800 domain-containing protein [Planctomycetes bacterium]|nr:DUF1800 domain-containing protein [Planctomycetota bacterium]